MCRLRILNASLNSAEKYYGKPIRRKTKPKYRSSTQSSQVICRRIFMWLLTSTVPNQRSWVCSRKMLSEFIAEAKYCPWMMFNETRIIIFHTELYCSESTVSSMQCVLSYFKYLPSLIVMKDYIYGAFILGLNIPLLKI